MAVADRRRVIRERWQSGETLLPNTTPPGGGWRYQASRRPRRKQRLPNNARPDAFRRLPNGRVIPVFTSGRPRTSTGFIRNA